MKNFCILFILTIGAVFTAQQQHNFRSNKIDKLTWCTKSIAEQYKCGNLSQAIERDRALFDDDFLDITCFRAFNADECIKHIDSDKADITSLDSGDVFTSGRFHSLIPIIKESADNIGTGYFSVAVLKTGTIQDVSNLRNLKGKKACFPWVGSLAGWIVPIYTLQQEGGMVIFDCNNQIKTAAKYFDSSCAVNSLIDKYNPIGDNSDKLCDLCAGKIPGKCSPSDPYYGYDGAFRCLLEAGDIAFLKHNTVQEMINGNEFKNLSPDRFELLCKDGSRKPIQSYDQCNWGSVPSDAIVTSSARTFAVRNKYQKFLQRAAQLYSEHQDSSTNPDRFDTRNGYKFDDRKNLQNTYNQNNRDPFSREQQKINLYSNRFDKIDSDFTTTTDRTLSNSTQVYEKFDLFESKRYGQLDLLFQDTTKLLLPIVENDQSFKNYLGGALDYIYGIRQCPVGRMTLCVTSDTELEKCVKMRTALKAQILKPDLLCYKAHSHINCMQAIQSGLADIAVFDAGDVYTGGLAYNLVPFMAEVYDLGKPEYYVVAVGKEEDPDTELTYLKGKSTCHTGINTAAGWTYPLAYLISNAWIRPYGCDSIRAAAEYFTKSCVPGAISSEYNTGVPYDSMCDLCHGTSFRYCRRDASEDYYGHTGAFRCLVEGGGHVAFVKHTTVNENTGGKRREWWARNTLNDDFELLCPDGTRAELSDYHRCNLGKVKSNAIVTRGGYGYNETQINSYINLLMYAQQLYGGKDVDDFSFSMFSSLPPYYDLIFQDATRKLQVIEPEQRRYDTYLGSDFMRARRITDCHSHSVSVHFSVTVLLIVSLAFTLQQ